jgi:hypothetical protein
MKYLLLILFSPLISKKNKNMITGNEPASPTIESINHGDAVLEIKTDAVGETLLQKWSAMAMQGMLASNWDGGEQDLSEAAVRIAKSLITELNKYYFQNEAPTNHISSTIHHLK